MSTELATEVIENGAEALGDLLDLIKEEPKIALGLSVVGLLVFSISKGYAIKGNIKHPGSGIDAGFSVEPGK